MYIIQSGTANVALALCLPPRFWTSRRGLVVQRYDSRYGRVFTYYPGSVALPSGVFDQSSITWAEAVQTAVSKAYLQASRYFDDVLAPWRIIGLLLRGWG